MQSDRIQRFRSTLSAHSLDSFLISNFYNIFYLTGFKTLTDDEREAFVLLTKKHIYLFTDARYVFTDPGVIFKLLEPGKGLLYHLNTIRKEEMISSLGIESEDLRVHEYMQLTTMMKGLRVKPLEKIGIRERMIKGEEEIQNIQKACEITDQCLKEIIATIAAGDSEKEIMFRIETWIKKKGCDLAFDPIVAVDANSAIPHYHTKEGSGSVKERSIILIDFGVMYNHYRSDITRMVFVRPDDQMMRAYNLLLDAQEKTLKEITKEDKAKAIDEFCRKELIREKLPDFPHSLGHGIGLEIHEFPKLSKNSEDSIQENMVFTIEPGIYYPGKWGMRIEDSVVIKNGKLQVLTRFPKEIMIL